MELCLIATVVACLLLTLVNLAALAWLLISMRSGREGKQFPRPYDPPSDAPRGRA